MRRREVRGEGGGEVVEEGKGTEREGRLQSNPQGTTPVGCEVAEERRGGGGRRRRDAQGHYRKGLGEREGGK